MLGFHFREKLKTRPYFTLKASVFCNRFEKGANFFCGVLKRDGLRCQNLPIIEKSVNCGILAKENPDASRAPVCAEYALLRDRRNKLALLWRVPLCLT